MFIKNWLNSIAKGIWESRNVKDSSTKKLKVPLDFSKFNKIMGTLRN